MPNRNERRGEKCFFCDLRLLSVKHFYDFRRLTEDLNQTKKEEAQLTKADETLSKKMEDIPDR